MDLPRLRALVSSEVAKAGEVGSAKRIKAERIITRAVLSCDPFGAIPAEIVVAIVSNLSVTKDLLVARSVSKLFRWAVSKATSLKLFDNFEADPRAFDVGCLLPTTLRHSTVLATMFPRVSVVSVSMPTLYHWCMAAAEGGSDDILGPLRPHLAGAQEVRLSMMPETLSRAAVVFIRGHRDAFSRVLACILDSCFQGALETPSNVTTLALAYTTRYNRRTSASVPADWLSTRLANRGVRQLRSLELAWPLGAKDNVQTDMANVIRTNSATLRDVLLKPQGDMWPQPGTSMVDALYPLAVVLAAVDKCPHVRCLQFRDPFLNRYCLKVVSMLQHIDALSLHFHRTVAKTNWEITEMSLDRIRSLEVSDEGNTVLGVARFGKHLSCFPSLTTIVLFSDYAVRYTVGVRELLTKIGTLTTLVWRSTTPIFSDLTTFVNLQTGWGSVKRLALSGWLVHSIRGAIRYDGERADALLANSAVETVSFVCEARYNAKPTARSMVLVNSTLASTLMTRAETVPDWVPRSGFHEKHAPRKRQLRAA